MKKPDPRYTLSYLSSLFKLENLFSKSSIKLVFPFYHAVSNDPGPHLKHLYKIKSEKEFVQDLDKLLKYFSPLSPEVLLENKAIQDKQGFILSFDDGLRELKDVISPILLRKGIPAIFFLNNNFINNEGLFYRYKASLILDFIKKNALNNTQASEINKIIPLRLPANKHSLIKAILKLNFQSKKRLDQVGEILEMDFDEYTRKSRPYLCSEEIMDLKKKGFYLGSHSFEHLDFFSLDPLEQQNEIIKSIKDIRDRFNLNYSLFAFPFSDYGVKLETLRKLYSDPLIAPDATFGTSGFRESSELPHYQRLSMEKYRGDSEKILKTEFIYFKLKRIVGKA